MVAIWMLLLKERVNNNFAFSQFHATFASLTSEFATDFEI